MCRLGWGVGGGWGGDGEGLVDRKPVVCCRLWTEENAVCSFCRVFILLTIQQLLAGGGFYHMVISGYLDHQSTQFRLSASELLLFVSVVLVLINALYAIPNCDDLVS